MQNTCNIPGECQTASKQKQRFPENYPNTIIAGKGAYIYDEKGNQYLDFMCALGPIILGYRFPEVDNYIIKTIKDYGTIFSLGHPHERLLAEILNEMIPSAEMVRFAHNGKDVTEAAVRLARHITGKETVLSFSYHGASDVFMACTKANNGVPKGLKKTIIDFDYNDFKTVEKLFDKHKVAAVILEPHTIRMPHEGYLGFLRSICNKHKALLIFDEVVSFPRYEGYSAQATFGIVPDLTCISKAMANGYPISALVGKEKYMKEFKDGGVFFSTTFGGNLVGVSAAIATLRFIQTHDVLPHIWELARLFERCIKPNPYFKVVGFGARKFFEFKNELDRWKLYQETIKKGLFFSIPIFFNYSMTKEDIFDACRTINGIVEKLDKIKLKGKMGKEVFKKR